MTPFLQLRLWWRRGSSAERLSATLAVAAVVSLAAWLLVPTGDDEPVTLSAAGGTAATGLAPGVGDPSAGAAALDGGAGDGAAPTVDVGVAAPRDVAAAGAGRTVGAGASAAGRGTAGRSSSGGTESTGGSRCAPAGDGTPGVSNEEIFIAVGLLELGGPIGNSAAGQAESGETERIAKAIIADINERGGVQCRKLVAKYYRGNPINPEQTRAACLQMIQDRPLLVADAGAFAYPQGAYNCLPQQKVPAIVGSYLLDSEVERFAPYLASPNGGAALAMRDVAFGARDLGLFDAAKGFKKLGLLFDECSPEMNGYLEANLRAAGVTSDMTSKYTFPCPSSGFAPPSQMSQAVAQHRADDVTHVIPMTGGGSFKPYTEIAEGQRFRPKYILTDNQGIIITSASSLKPNPDNFDRAIGITTGRFGQESTPGMQHDPGTLRCQGLVQKAGFPPNYVFKGGGTMCNALWTAEAALKGTRELRRDAALPGLFNAGSIQLSWPTPDVTFRPPAKYYGGDTWWPIEWHKECTCWRVLDPNRRPSYPA